MQIVVLCPVLYFVLAYEVHRADKLHSREICTVELRHHGLHLTAVDHAHEYGLDNVVKVMTQRYLIAAEFLRLVVEVSAAHSRAEVAGIILHIIHGIENVRFKHCYRNVHHSCVCLDYCAVLAAVAGIHDQEHKLEIKFAVALYLLEQLRHQHGILAAGNTHGYLVTRLEQLVLVKSLCKLAENTAVKLLGQAAFNLRSAVGAALERDLMNQPAHIAPDEVNSVAALGTEPFRDLLVGEGAVFLV